MGSLNQVKSVRLRFGLGVGERGKWSGGGRERIANRSRSATPVAEPQTEARRSCGQCEIAARDERAGSVAERARSRGDRADRQPMKPERKARWLRRSRAMDKLCAKRNHELNRWICSGAVIVVNLRALWFWTRREILNFVPVYGAPAGRNR